MAEAFQIYLPSLVTFLEQKQLGAIHGYLLTAWSLGGLIGPTLVSQIYTRTTCGWPRDDFRQLY